jgi:hypothetical protein
MCRAVTKNAKITFRYDLFGEGHFDIQSGPEASGTVSHKPGSVKDWPNPVEITPPMTKIFFISTDQRSVPRPRKVRFRIAIQDDQVIEGEATDHIAGPISTPLPDEDNGIAIPSSSPSSAPFIGVRG